MNSRAAQFRSCCHLLGQHVMVIGLCAIMLVTSTHTTSTAAATDTHANEDDQIRSHFEGRLLLALNDLYTVLYKIILKVF